MLAAGRWFVGFRPEVRDLRDQPVSEGEERHRIVNAVIEAPLEPHHPVMLVSNHDLGPQMPVPGVLLIEPQVAIAAADALPRLRDLVDHGRMQQRRPVIPVPGLQAGDEALHQLAVIVHPGKLPHPGHARATRSRDPRLTATVTATAAAVGHQQRPATAHDTRMIRAKWGYARPEKRKAGGSTPPLATSLTSQDPSEI